MRAFGLWALLLATTHAPLAISGEKMLATEGGGKAFIQQNDEGWFFYNEKIEEEVPEPEPVLPPPPPPPPVAKAPVEPTPAPGPEPMSTAWFRENMQKYEDIAIDDPTPENISRYYYLQRVSMDKAQRFADVAQQVVLSDPYLDESTRRPLSQYGTSAFDKAARDAINSSMRKISDAAGIFFFYNDACDICPKAAEVLSRITAIHGLVVNAVSVDGNPLPNDLFPDFKPDTGQAKSLGINNYPAIYLALPPADLFVLGHSALAINEIEERVLMVAEQNDLITKAEYEKTRPFNDNSIDTTKLQVSEAMLGDPEQLKQYLRKKMENSQ